MMKLTEQLIKFFKRPEEETKREVPGGVCPVCWGHQEYDQKIRRLYRDKQIDVNNHQASYLAIKEFVVHHIDGIRLREGEVENCPTCGHINDKEQEGKTNNYE
ncbi:MAG TPA: hypothetical protein PKN99_09240 [Cyclobacteriaceae bacterium]|nr:hypothetical protein [Cyclobacteriaceae bacterium]